MRSAAVLLPPLLMKSRVLLRKSVEYVIIINTNINLRKCKLIFGIYYKDGEFIREPIDAPIEIDHGELPENVPVFYYELNHFAMAIAGEVAPDVNASNAYTFMQILDAFYDSAKSGEKVYI